MHRHVLGLLPLLAALLAINVSGCSPVEEPTGSVQFISRLQQSLSSSEVSRVKVTLTAEDLPTRTVELAEANGQWGGVMGHIQAGTGRTFSAEAFSASGTKLYAGQVTGVTILKGQTTVVALTLQQVQGPPPFQNAVPIIDSLVASGSGVEPGGRLTLQASAHDPNPNDTLTYAWTASAGTLATPTHASTDWTAPQQVGSVTLTLAVTDPHGSVASLSVTLTVRKGVGDAAIDIRFNNWPQVSRITATPSRVQVGQTTEVTATATDSDGDALSYQWSAEGCTGTWTNATARTAWFTPDAAPVEGPCSCRLKVQGGDGRGGTAEGTLNMCVGEAVEPGFAPEVVGTYQSATSVPAGGTVRLQVEGQDPQGSALGFSWTASVGTLGAPASGATTSEVVWTAPACLDASGASITVTLSNARGLTASQVFHVQGLRECTPLPSGTWASVGSMHLTRSWHSATLLPSGEVLFAGGWGPPWGPQAEVYNPDTNVSVGSVGGNRYGMTTAMVLPTGKVLAVGSTAAELFDPVTRSWTPAGGMPGADFLAATPLSSGKVLVTGGYRHTSGLATARLYDAATEAWTDTQAMLSVRWGHTATLLPSGKVLVTGGFVQENLTVTTTEVYDPVTGSWASSSSMAFRRAYHTALALPSGKVLVVGGIDENGEQAPSEVYDPETETWLPAGGSMATCQTRTATLLPSGKVLVTGCQGLYPSNVSTAEVYDPVTGTWTPTGSLNVRRDYSTATLLPSGKVLVAGYSPAMELYDPVTGTWSLVGAQVQSRSGHTTVLLPSGKVLVAGGDSEDGTLAELYEPVTTAWATTGAMLSARRDHTATLLPSGKVLVVGGSGGQSASSLATAEVYDPAAGSWAPTGGLATGRASHTATLLPSGKVLVVGGYDQNANWLATAEVYDPATGVWTPTGSLAVARTRHTSTLLPSGKVLVTGGTAVDGLSLGSSEVYDPVRGSWAPTAPMVRERVQHSATLLASGKVLVVGGANQQSGILAAAELYDPWTETWAQAGSMAMHRVGHTATLLGSGKVLIVGDGSQPVTMTEVYDPETGSWSSAGDIFGPRYGHTVTLLPSGRVLLLGGSSSGGGIALAMLYVP